jgi:serine/threonine protein phosphatase PrpC
MSWKFGAAINIGGRNEQQDRLTVLSAQGGRRHLIAVADGMGGLRNGAQAAQIVVDVAAHNFTAHACIADPQTFLHGICQAAHDRINKLHKDAGPAPGTTVLLLYIDNRYAYWTHVGDSRLYHFRGGRLLAQTNDHSFLRLMSAKGSLDPGGVSVKAMQSQLYMRLGGEHTPRPDFAWAEVRDGDLFVLCSDGFWQAVPPNQIVAALGEHPLHSDGPQFLVDLARKRSGEKCDNISLALGQWTDESGNGLIKRFVNAFRKRG